MDASIYTERPSRVVKPPKTPKKEARRQKYLAKLQHETESARARLYPILYRKGTEKGKLVVTLSESTLDRLAHNHAAVSPGDRTRELYEVLYKHLDGEGLVNRRVIKIETDRLAAVKQIVDDALASGEVETITRVSRLTIELSPGQMRIQEAAASAHEARLEEQRSSRKDSVPVPS